jgi:hypothetical protein
MRKLTLLLSVLIFTLVLLCSCRVGDDGHSSSGTQGSTDNGGGSDNPGNNSSGGDTGDDSEGVADNKIYLLADSEVSEDYLNRISDRIYELSGIRPTVGEGEGTVIAIGRTSNGISSKAYRRLSRIPDSELERSHYLIYSDGRAVAIAYEGDRYGTDASLDMACEAFSKVICADDGGLVLRGGVLSSGEVDPIKWQREIDEGEREAAFEALAEAIGGELGEEIADAIRDYYGMFSVKVVEWIANLYDPECGGFYYSNSGRDTVGYGADIESTQQALSFLSSSGALAGIDGSAANMPRWFTERLGRWVKSLQDSNGYFYHQQWTKEMVDGSLARRGRDLWRAESLLEWCGFAPTYTTPNGMTGDYTLVDGTKVGDVIVVKATGRLGSSSVACASRVIAASSLNAPSHLRTEAALLNYLSSLDIRANSYPVGNELCSQALEIKNLDDRLKASGSSYSPVAIIEEWLRESQNPENGMWYYVDESDPSYSIYDGVNGLLKISAMYNDLGMEFNYPLEAVRSAIEGTRTDDEPLHVCYAYNTWFSVLNIFKNMEAHSDNPELAAAEIAAIRAELLESAPEAIAHTGRKVAMFMKTDGSFSYYKNYTNHGSQGMPVALPNMNEGDVNATTICANGTASYMFQALGIEVPHLFGMSEWYRFIGILEELGAVIKDENIYEKDPVTFDEESVGGESDYVSITSSGKGSFTVERDTRAGHGGNIFRFESVKGGALVLDCVDPLVKSCYSFEGEFCFESGDSGYNCQIRLGRCYMLGLSLEYGNVRIFDTSSESSPRLETDFGVSVPIGEWFKLRLEYYPDDHDSVRAKIYVDDKLVAVNDNYYNYSGNKITTGTGTPQSAMSELTLTAFSTADLTILMDNLAVWKTNVAYEAASDPENQPLYNVDAPDRKEKVYDLEGLSASEIYPADFTVSEGADTVERITESKNSLLRIVGTAGGGSEIGIPLNIRTKTANCDIFEADLCFDSANVGAAVEIGIFERKVGGSSAARVHLLCTEESGTKYFAIYSAPSGKRASLIDGARIPIGESIGLRLEYYKTEGSVLVYIDGVLVGSTDGICPTAPTVKTARLAIKNLGGKGFALKLDNIKVERNLSSYSEATAPTRDSVIYGFESDFGDLVLQGAYEAVTVKKDKLLSLTSGGSALLPLNKRSAASSAYLFSADVTVRAEGGIISLESTDGEVIASYELIKSGKTVGIHELTENRRYEVPIAELEHGKECRLSIEYYPSAGEIHILVDGECVAVSSILYSEDAEALIPDGVRIMADSSGEAIYVDDCCFESYVKLCERKELGGSGDVSDGGYSFESDSTGRLPSGVVYVSDVTRPGITEVRERDGEYGKVLSYTSPAGSYDKIYFGLNSKEPECAYTVFETDMLISYADGTSNTTVEIFLTDTPEHHSYLLLLRRQSGIIQVCDVSGTSEAAVPGRVGGDWADTAAIADRWFRLRIEYRHGSADTVKILTYINGALVYESDRFYGKSTENKLAQPTGDADRIRMSFYSATAATVLYDNVTFMKVKQAGTPERLPDDPWDIPNCDDDSPTIGFEDSAPDNLPDRFTVILGSESSSVTVEEMNRGGESGKVLGLTTVKGSADTVRLGITEESEGYNVTAFESDVYIRHNGGSSAYGFELYLTDASGLHSYLLLLSISDVIKISDNSGNSETNVPGRIPGAQIAGPARDTWFHIRVEYRHGSADTTKIITYINGVSVYESDRFYGKSSTATDKTPYGNITEMRFIPNTGLNATVYFDNMRLAREKLEISDDTPTDTPNEEDGSAVLGFESSTSDNLPSAIAPTLGSVNSSVSIVETEREGEKTNALAFTTLNGSTDRLTLAVTSDAEEYTKTVFSADMMVKHLGGSSAYGFELYLTNGLGEHSYLMLQRIGDAGYQIGDISANAKVSGSGGEDIRVVNQLEALAPNGKWFNLKIEYYHGDRGSVRIITYVDGVKVLESTNFYGSHNENAEPAGDITEIRFIPNTGISASVYLDNVSLVRE